MTIFCGRVDTSHEIKLGDRTDSILFPEQNKTECLLNALLQKTAFVSTNSKNVHGHAAVSAKPQRTYKFQGEREKTSIGRGFILNTIRCVTPQTKKGHSRTNQP